MELRASAMISSPKVITAPTGTSPASAATAAKSSARRIGCGRGKAMASRPLAGSAAAVMPAKRANKVSVGVGLRLLGRPDLHGGDIDLGLVALYLNFWHGDIGFTCPDFDRSGLDLERRRLSGLRANRTAGRFDGRRPCLTGLRNIEVTRGNSGNQRDHRYY